MYKQRLYPPNSITKVDEVSSGSPHQYKSMMIVVPDFGRDKGIINLVPVEG